MTDFVPGQRWINYAELHMELGTVLSVEHRTVSLVFTATGDTRAYAKQTAPLSRVTFKVGDRINSHEGWSMEVDAIKEKDGLMTYTGVNNEGHIVELTEGELNSRQQLNRPAERLLIGLIDKDKWFKLRYQTLFHTNRLASSELRGLTGGRTTLIPHQLYIAHEVANRYAPRVLLADEVGLGKTIEAGMILHHQLLTERAKRILIVVPETLLHQWLVEMLRKFNLQFSIFDVERCEAIESSGEQENPFYAEQLVLCTLEFLVSHPDRHHQAVAGDWDLLVVDEAHHLQWSPQQVSPEYQLIEQLAYETRGVLLLTATPEQLGKESHFARLRLLDPDRFQNFEAFVEEEQHYEPVAQAVTALLEGESLSPGILKTLGTTLKEGDNQQYLETLQDDSTKPEKKESARTHLVEHLLDRHGTGRVLFRNTRSAVNGFSERVLKSYPLPLPKAYEDCFAKAGAKKTSTPQQLLCPELLYQSIEENTATHWASIDPRVDWLEEQLKQLRPEKVLVITASAETTLDLAEALRTRSGTHAAVFHEGMTLVDRDRAAAYFADLEFGTQILICSEIGSEGRNFQFAHHLILFDLPLNPDLLEQRIGRLDRIGQKETIQIHVPYLEHSAQNVMLNWYHEGLGAFEHTCPAGHSVFVQVETQLLAAIHAGDTDPSTLIDTSRELHHRLNEALHRGRDQLLEYNSCRPHIANTLPGRVRAQDTASPLMDYLETVFDCYNVDLEGHSEGSYIIHPSEHMQVASFPGLKEEGMTFTCDREIALLNEDRHFMSWEHPLVTGAMEMILSNEQGNTAVTAIKYEGAKSGTMLLECLYTLDAVASDALQTRRYLPPTSIRVVTDVEGRDHSTRLPHESIGKTRDKVPADTASKIVRAYSKELRNMIEKGEALANKQAPKLLAAAQEQAKQTLGKEINRLSALSKINPNVRAEETGFMELQWEALTTALSAATLRLDALRIIVVM